MTGRVYGIAGPSGAGKDTLMAAVKDAMPEIRLVRRVITRPEQPGGEPFEGVSEAAFEARAAAGEFALSWGAHDLRYGVPASELAPAAQGAVVLVNLSRSMLAEAAARLPRFTAVIVEATPEIRAQRLAARGRERAADIAKRLARTEAPLPANLPFLRIQNNGPLHEAVDALCALLQAESV